MELKRLKEYYRRFRAWQIAPLKYEMLDTEPCHCMNCGHTFTGNYCPYCSQKRNVGRFTWTSVHQAIMEPWGINSRSMPYTLLQLIFRPGHLIRNYISGRRQVSFPPVKMLFIIAAIVAYVEHTLIPEKAAASVAEAKKSIDPADSLYESFDQFIDWIQVNPGWGSLLSSLFLLFPTWVFFRNAPRYPRHTLPEGFFIQVFLSILSLFLTLLSDMTSNVFNYIVLLYYVYTYHQLFGYSLWGTIWRLTTTFCWVIFAVLAIVFLYLGCTTIPHADDPEIARTGMLVSSGTMVFFCIVLLLPGYFISHRKKTERDSIPAQS